MLYVITLLQPLSKSYRYAYGLGGRFGLYMANMEDLNFGDLGPYHKSLLI